MSCLLGETGASIMGVQKPLASKGILTLKNYSNYEQSK